MEVWVQFLRWCSGLRIQRCSSCGGIGHSCGSNLIPGLRPSIGSRCGRKRKKKQEEEEREEKRNTKNYHMTWGEKRESNWKVRDNKSHIIHPTQQPLSHGRASCSCSFLGKFIITCNCYGPRILHPCSFLIQYKHFLRWLSGLHSQHCG